MPYLPVRMDRSAVSTGLIEEPTRDAVSSAGRIRRVRLYRCRTAGVVMPVGDGVSSMQRGDHCILGCS